MKSRKQASSFGEPVTQGLAKEMPMILAEQFLREGICRVPDIIKNSSQLSVEARWLSQFQTCCSLSEDTTNFLNSLFKVTDPSDLQPRYIVEDGKWGAVISPRANSRTKKRFCFIEEWFVSDPSSLITMVKSVQESWHLPYDRIKIRAFCDDPSLPTLMDHPKIYLEEYVYVLDSETKITHIPLHEGMEKLFAKKEISTDKWWPNFKNLLEQSYLESFSNPEIIANEMKHEMDHLINVGGGILNIYDSLGLAGHVSWEPMDYAEILIPECWFINFVLVRPDLQGLGFAKYLYSLASQHLDVNKNSTVCAIVEKKNTPSIMALQRIGGAPVVSYFTIQQRI